VLTDIYKISQNAEQRQAQAKPFDKKRKTCYNKASEWGLVESDPLSYRIEYSPEAFEHLRALTARQQAVVLNAVDRRLAHQPTVETRNRKPMRPNPLALWELRIGPLRSYYDVEDKPEHVVRIRAIGIKERSRVIIGKEVIPL
jgi:mRNA-degrading endonuclease RelE of RelBE toxin-antitoxin system